MQGTSAASDVPLHCLVAQPSLAVRFSLLTSMAILPATLRQPPPPPQSQPTSTLHLPKHPSNRSNQYPKPHASTRTQPPRSQQSSPQTPPSLAPPFPSPHPLEPRAPPNTSSRTTKD